MSEDDTTTPESSCARYTHPHRAPPWKTLTGERRHCDGTPTEDDD